MRTTAFREDRCPLEGVHFQSSASSNWLLLGSAHLWEGMMSRTPGFQAMHRRLSSRWISRLRVAWVMTGRTPLHCAALGSQAGWLDASQAGMAKPAAPPKTRLDHSLIAIELLGQGVDPTALDDARCSALHYASGADLRPQLLFQKLSPVAIFIVQPCVMPQA